MDIKENSVFLFQGDGITNAGRNFDEPESLGFGYAMLFATLVQTYYPHLNVKFIY